MEKTPIWLEAWIESGYYSYVLLLQYFEDGRFEVTDPQEKHRVIGIFQTYEEAYNWLREDEFERIGRYSTIDE